jgi:uncharacterized protein
MRTVDVAVAALLVIGGLNWGLVGVLEFDLVATLLGSMSIPSRAVYALVGLSAIYQGLSWTMSVRRGVPVRA